jgi:TolB-like protein
MMAQHRVPTLLLSFALLTLLAACGAAAPPAAVAQSAPPPAPNEPLKGLAGVTDAAERAARMAKDSGASRIAILEIRSLAGQRTMLGRFMAEEITTSVQRIGRPQVVERRLIEDMMSEGSFAETGLIDDSTAAEVGGKLGADAVLTGTLTEIGDVMRFNLRIIDTNSGRVSGATQASFLLDDALRKLWAKRLGTAVAPAAPAPSLAAPAPAPPAQPAQFFFEDFSKVPEGNIPQSWTGGDKLLVKKGGRGKRLIFADNGRVDDSVVTVPISWPTDFRIDVTFNMTNGYYNWVDLSLGSLSWGVSPRKIWFAGDKIKMKTEARSGSTLSVEKRGAVFRVYLDGDQKFLKRISKFSAPRAGIKLKLQQSDTRNVELLRIAATRIDTQGNAAPSSGGAYAAAPSPAPGNADTPAPAPQASEPEPGDLHPLFWSLGFEGAFLAGGADPVALGGALTFGAKIFRHLRLGTFVDILAAPNQDAPKEDEKLTDVEGKSYALATIAGLIGWQALPSIAIDAIVGYGLGTERCVDWNEADCTRRMEANKGLAAGGRLTWSRSVFGVSLLAYKSPAADTTMGLGLSLGFH